MTEEVKDPDTTLLDGKRNSTRPIHRRRYFKALTKQKLIDALEYFESVLQRKI